MSCCRGWMDGRRCACCAPRQRPKTCRLSPRRRCSAARTCRAVSMGAATATSSTPSPFKSCKSNCASTFLIATARFPRSASSIRASTRERCRIQCAGRSVVPSLDKAIAIVKSLRMQGHESYLAGGCVRDMLLKKIPQDYDITTSAQPDDIAAIFPQTVPVGAQFGVMLVIDGGEPFDAEAFGNDGRSLDGG